MEQTEHLATGTRVAGQRRRAYRSTDDRLLGGVATGVARHLQVDPLLVRLFFVVATVLGGFGIALYAGLWMFLPSDPHLVESSPGLEAASRQGKRRTGRRGRLGDAGPLVALVAVGLGLAFLAQSVVGGSFLFWPVVVGLAGVAVLWRQADEAQRERWIDASGRLDVARALLGRGGVASYARIAAGLGLLVTAMLLFAVQTGRLGIAREVLTAAVLGVLGLALVVGPWVVRLAGDLSEERAARVRTEERADVAAHLHDSVLQTLALIQKHSEDGRMVSTLARAQERDLRSWLYGGEAAPAASLASALRLAAGEVEDTHGTPVEVVTVGDTPVGEQLRPLVLAAREAMVNAAKHSGAPRVDVYAEVHDRDVELFVRDRGQGFDEATVPDDRLGVRNSIHDRMRRHGGEAEVRSTLGEGTEVRLAMPVTPREEKGEA